MNLGAHKKMLWLSASRESTRMHIRQQFLHDIAMHHQRPTQKRPRHNASRANIRGNFQDN